MNAAVPFTTDELKDMVYLKLGRNPIDVWCQGLLVVSTFEDGQTAVHRIETLVVSGAMSLKWSPSQYLEAEGRLS